VIFLPFVDLFAWLMLQLIPDRAPNSSKGFSLSSSGKDIEPEEEKIV